MKGHIDWQFGAALLAAVLFWGTMFFAFQFNLVTFEPMPRPTMIIMAVLVYPVVEELVFRGVLQGGLREKRWGVCTIGTLTYANIITSLIFSSFHLLNHAPLWAVAIFIPSLIFGYFRDRYDGGHYALLAPVALHCFYNAGWLSLVFL